MGGGWDLRSCRANGKKDPRQQQLRVHIMRLDKEKQRQANDGVPRDGDIAHAAAVRDEAPDGTGDQGDDLIDEAEGADDVTDAVLDADEIGDDEGDAAVEGK